MRFFKILLYILVVFVLQTVVFSRINFMGVVPDLVLVSIVIFAVLEERNPATFFAASFAFIQDIFSSGIYLNTILKTIVSNVISSLKEEFIGDEYTFAAGMVAVFTPLYVLTEGLILLFVFHKEYSLPYFIFRMAAATIYNLVLLPVLFPIVKVITHAE